MAITNTSRAPEIRRVMKSAALTVAALFAAAILSATPVQAQTLTVLHTFTGGLDGGRPIGTLTMDRAGNLYGTASKGGFSRDSAASTDAAPCSSSHRSVPTGSSLRFTISRARATGPLLTRELRLVRMAACTAPLRTKAHKGAVRSTICNRRSTIAARRCVSGVGREPSSSSRRECS